MDNSKRKEKILAFIGSVEKTDSFNSSVFRRNLDELIYSMNERNVWENGNQLTDFDVIKAWCLVQKLLTTSKVPEELKM